MQLFTLPYPEHKAGVRTNRPTKNDSSETSPIIHGFRIKGDWLVGMANTLPLPSPIQSEQVNKYYIPVFSR